MQSDLAQAFLDKLRSSLEQKSLVLPSRYAEKVRIMGEPFPGPWSFAYHPWLRDVMDCPAEEVNIQKAAQMGFTEAALNKVFHTIGYRHLDVMYVLPSKTPDASDFSSGRFDPALELSEELRNLFTDADNMGHKRAGNANLYVRGSRSKSQLKSVPINFLVLDEVDEMVQENIPLALERLSGQRKGAQHWKLSTPTIEAYGINLYYDRSNKCEYFFPCPHCGRMINLEFPRNLLIVGDDPHSPLIRQSQLMCHECNLPLDHEAKREFLARGEWVPSNRESTAAGFHISQLYSCAVKPAKLAQKALLARTNPADEQELYNSALGLPHAVEGARVTDREINLSFGDFLQHDPLKSRNYEMVTMGVDVGKVLHVEIAAWYWERFLGLDTNVFAKCKVIKIAEVHHFHQLDQLMSDYNVRHCVIDLNPERRLAREFAARHWGRVHCCEYPVGVNGRNIKEDEDNHMVQVDRTSWLDLSLGRFHEPQSISLPQDTPNDYREHIKALTRVYYHDNHGNVRARYVHGQVADHYAHARNYNEVAFTLATAMMGNTSVTSPV